jgi:ADP-ribosyl-[dinitrogen reductase] hydrolase
MKRLFEKGNARILPSPFLFAKPTPLPSDFSFNRIRGMMLGLAIGNGLGNTSEGRIGSDRLKAFGEASNYQHNRYVGDCLSRLSIR